MKIVDIIPITKDSKLETLTYVANSSINIGNLVEIPIRNKVMKGIVIDERSVIQAKSEIKNALFSMKKVKRKIGTKDIFSSNFFKSIKDMSLWFIGREGLVIHSLSPKIILENIDKVASRNKGTKEKEAQKEKSKVFLVQGDDEERYATWKSIVRQEFAKNKSVFILCPTNEDAMDAYKRIEKGIEGYVVLIHGKLKKDEIINAWNKIIREDHPLAIVCTSQYLSVPRYDISTIILEKEQSRGYKTIRRPYIDIRRYSINLANKMSADIYLGDILLRTETLNMIQEGEAEIGSPFKFRSLTTAVSKVINMKKPGYEIFDLESINLIEKGRTESKHTLILAMRRGMSSTTVCGDCGEIVKCNICSSPMVLHQKNERRFFMCHKCGERRSAEEYCAKCNSWKLNPLGTGIDRVYEYLEKNYPDIKIFRIDSDSVANSQKANKIIQDFFGEPGSILLGTEMALNYIKDKVDQSIIVSLDNLFALPDFRINEKIMWLILKVKSITRDISIIQTRKYEEKVFEYSTNGNISDFVKENIENRKQFNYPPETTLIKITIEGKKDETVNEMQKIQDLIKNKTNIDIEIFPAFTHTIKGDYVLHGLIRIEKSKWVNYDLVEILRSLPRNVFIDVDPESLL